MTLVFKKFTFYLYFLSIIMSKTSFKRPYNDRLEFFSIEISEGSMDTWIKSKLHY